MALYNHVCRSGSNNVGLAGRHRLVHVTLVHYLAHAISLDSVQDGAELQSSTCHWSLCYPSCHLHHSCTPSLHTLKPQTARLYCKMCFTSPPTFHVTTACQYKFLIDPLVASDMNGSQSKCIVHFPPRKPRGTSQVQGTACARAGKATRHISGSCMCAEIGFKDKKCHADSAPCRETSTTRHKPRRLWPLVDIQWIWIAVAQIMCAGSVIMKIMDPWAAASTVDCLLLIVRRVQICVVNVRTWQGEWFFVVLASGCWLNEMKW